MLTHPIETIIFDLDGTLRHNLPSANDIQLEFLSQLGIQNSLQDQKKGARWVHYYWAQSAELFSDLGKYGEMNDEFWGNYSYRYLQVLIEEDRQAFEIAPLLSAHMLNNFTSQDHVYPCVPETLAALKAGGYNLGLVSNRSNPCQEYCETLGLIDYFQFAYVAAEVDAWKPDPRIFDRALHLTGSKPENTVYVGDNYFADVRGAMNAGIQPILYDPKSIFPDVECTKIRQIKELGIIL